MDPALFLRGNPYPGIRNVPYPRARPDDFMRLPVDTWAMAAVPVGVRLEFTGDAPEISIAYETRTDELGFRDTAAGRSFQLWRDGVVVSEEKAVLGAGTVRLPCGSGSGRATVYLPEGMMPTVTALEAHGGLIDPAPAQRRWVCYGDSIAEGWVASGPAYGWPAIVARTHALDLFNMGYAGAARGEVVSAEHVAALPADVISISYGTNCWTRIPFSAAMFRADLIGFLDVVRQSHALTPIVVVSPVLRPEGESKPNRLGATLADLRAVMEEVVGERASGDAHLRLVRGLEILDATMLHDGVHPNDSGHAAMAAAIGPVVASGVA
jgi:lysophospholipase L1-like esterase